MKCYFVVFSLLVFCLGHLRAEAPANDDRAAAAVVEPGVVVAGSLSDSTLEDVEESRSGILGSVWYEWPEVEEGRWEFRVTSRSAQVVPVAYLVLGDGSLKFLGEGAFTRSEPSPEAQFSIYLLSKAARFEVPAGARVVFQVGARTTEDADFSLVLAPVGPGPAGDAFSEAVELSGGRGEFVVAGEFATLEQNEPDNEWAGTVWRSWAVPEAGNWLIGRTSLGGAGGVDVWRGEDLASLESAVVGSGRASFDGGSGALLPSDRVVVNAVAGERLWIRVMVDTDAENLLSIEVATKGDLFADPVNLGRVTEGEHVRQFSERLTFEAEEPRASSGTQWLRWEAPQSGGYEVEVKVPQPDHVGGISGEIRPLLAIYRGEALDVLEVAPKVSAGITDRFYRFEAEAGEVFRLRLGISGSTGWILYSGAALPGFPTEVRLALRNLGEGPLNDDFLAADDFGAVSDGVREGSNVAATQEANEELRPNGAGDSVWHRWTAPRDGGYEFVFSSEENLGLQLLRGAEIDALTEVGRVGILPGQGGNGVVRMRFAAEAGALHYLRIVGGGNGAQGEYALELKELSRPVNDDLASSISLGSTIPAMGSGTTVGGSAGDVVEPTWTAAGTSSIWWKWLAPESGFFELQADGSLGLLEDGVRVGFTLGLSTGDLVFEASEGKEYHFRVAHHWHEERNVELRLDRALGLDHVTRETAIVLGSAMRFSTEVVESRRGRILNEGYLVSPGVWFEWEPPASGWVAFDTGGSAGPVNLKIKASEGDGNSVTDSPNSAPFIEEWVPYVRTGVNNFGDRRGFLRSGILRDLSLVPAVTRSLYEVEAGEKYLITVTPSDPEASGLAEVQLNVFPAGGPPYSNFGTWELSEDGGFLTATISVVSPNGFHSGIIFGAPSALATGGFTGRNRISGDQYAGDYRVVIPWLPRSSNYFLRPRIQLVDQLGVSLSQPWGTGNLEPVVEEKDWVDSLAPVVEGVAGGFRRVELEGEDVSLSLELAISDNGGSGFFEGMVWLPGAGARDYGSEFAVGAVFGPEARIRGDDEVGIYRVEVVIPAGTPRGYLGVQLRDRAGVFSEREPSVIGGVDRGAATRGVELPVWIERVGEESGGLVPVELTEGGVRLSGEEVIASGRLNHPGGVFGGEVVLLDEMGGVIAARGFGAGNRVEGSETSGRYEVSLSAPQVGFGGRHWVAWILVGSDGSEVSVPSVASLELPDRRFVDSRAPVLTRIQVAPPSLDLLTGAGELEVSLGGHDDRAGFVAEVMVFDGRGQLLVKESIECASPQLDCTMTLQLPQLDGMSHSAEGRIVVHLRDKAGREARYGEPGGANWPLGSRPVLPLFEGEASRLERWVSAWPGVRQVPVDGNEDSDGDGWSDLLEFGLGTDPGVLAERDPLAGRLPMLGPLEPAFAVGGFERLMRLDFAPAPWLIDPGQAEWEILVEGSDDLVNWEELEIPFGLSERTSAFKPAPREQRVGWMRIRIR